MAVKRNGRQNSACKISTTSFNQRGVPDSACAECFPEKLIEQLDGRGFQQQSGPVVRVGEDAVRPSRQPGDLAVRERERFLGLQFVFPKRGHPPGFEFHAEYCAATITKRVAVSFPCGMVQDDF